jgi:tetratricopeptide (TPR) repeat protein
MKVILLRAAAAGIALFSLSIRAYAIAGANTAQICDVSADYSLGIEDYPSAVRLHLEVVRQHPENALAHYHLGYAYGMLGNGFSELKEFRQAEALGLRRWDLYLNMGLAQRDIGQLESATRSMQRSVFLGPEHPESHLDLALLYHDQGRLADA